MKTTAPIDEVYRIIFTDHHDPFRVLGIHLIDHHGAPAVVVRAFLPGAESAFVVPTEKKAGRMESPRDGGP